MFDFNDSKADRANAERLAHQNAPFDVHSALGAIRGSAWSIAITAVLFVLGASVVVAIVPERYIAATQILIEPTSLRVVDKSVIDSSQLNDTANSQVESQSRILVSRTVLAHVVDQQALTADAEFNSAQRGLLDTATGPMMTAAASQQNASEGISVATVDNLQRHVRVERLPQSFVVELSVSTHDATKSARLANAIAQAYLEEEATSQAITARRASDSLSARLNSLREDARAAEEKVEQFKQQNKIVVATGHLMTEAQAAEINSQFVLAGTRTAAAKARFDQVKQLLKTGFDVGELSESVASPTIARLRDQYADAARHEAALAGSLGSQHPALIQARSDLTRARSLLNEELVRIARSTRDEYERAAANEASLANNLQAVKDEVLKTGEAAVTLRELERDAQAKRNMYDALAVRAREIGEQAWIDTRNIRIISPAAAPSERSFPPSTSLILSAAFILGFGAASSRAVLRHPGRYRMLATEKQISDG